MPHQSTSRLYHHQRIIFACDAAVIDVAFLSKLEALLPHIGMVKFGPEFFSALIRMVIIGDHLGLEQMLEVFKLIRENDVRIMLDAKMFDIYRTVAAAACISSDTPGVGIFTYHAAMRHESIQPILKSTLRTKTVAAGVTLLTDYRNDEDVHSTYGRSLRDAFLLFANRIMVAARLTGAHAAIVSSAHELEILRTTEPIVGDFRHLIKITPSIRFEDSPLDDQARTMTPKEAIRAGADYLVVGRPIRQTPNWTEAAKRIANEIYCGIR